MLSTLWQTPRWAKQKGLAARFEQETLTTHRDLIIPKATSPRSNQEEEVKMQTLHAQQIWELTLSHQANLRKEAKMAHLAHLAQMAEQPQQAWWKSIFNRQPEASVVVLETSATPELG